MGGNVRRRLFIVAMLVVALLLMVAYFWASEADSSVAQVQPKVRRAALPQGMPIRPKPEQAKELSPAVEDERVEAGPLVSVQVVVEAPDGWDESVVVVDLCGQKALVFTRESTKSAQLSAQKDC